MDELMVNLNTILKEKEEKISPENIREGITIFDIEGTLKEGIDTSDANATASDLLKDKIAYVNNEKVIGTLEMSQYNVSIKNNGKETFQFNNADIEIKDLDLTGVTSLASAFYNLTNLKSICLLDTTNITSMRGTFNGCSSLKEIPLFNTHNVTDIAYMLQSCSSLTTVPLFDLTNAKDMSHMFYGCSNLEEIPLLDTSNITNMSHLLGGCNKLKTIPFFNTSKVISMGNMFWYNKGIKEVPQYDTQNVTDMIYMFQGCEALETVPLLNLQKVTNIASMFDGCTALLNLGGFKDLGKAFTSKTTNRAQYCLRLSAAKNLTYESLINVINNLYDLNLAYNVANGGTLYTQSLVLGTDNLQKLEATEEGLAAIALATSKGWTVS